MAHYDVGASRRPWWALWAGDSALLLVSQAATTLIGTALVVVLARTLTRAELGAFGALLAISQALSLAFTLGVGTWLLREFAAAKGDRHGSSRNLIAGANRLIIPTSATAAAAAPLVALGAGLSVDLAITQGALIIYVAELANAGVYESWLRAERRVRNVALATAIEKVILLAVVVAVAVAGAGVLAVAAAHIAAGFARVVYSRYSCLKRMQREPTGAIPGRRWIVRQSAPFAVSAVGINLIPRLDVAIVMAVSAVAASEYVVSERIATLAYLAPTIASRALYPFLGGRATAGADRHAVRIMGVAGLVVSALGLLLAPMVVPALFGENYDGAVPVVQTMMLGVPFAYCTNALMAVTYSRGGESAAARTVVPLSLIGTGVVAIGALSHHAVGAAAGHAVRQVLVMAGFVTALRLQGKWVRASRRGNGAVVPQAFDE